MYNPKKEFKLRGLDQILSDVSNNYNSPQEESLARVNDSDLWYTYTFDEKTNSVSFSLPKAVSVIRWPLPVDGFYDSLMPIKISLAVYKNINNGKKESISKSYIPLSDDYKYIIRR